LEDRFGSSWGRAVVRLNLNIWFQFCGLERGEGVGLIPARIRPTNSTRFRALFTISLSLHSCLPYIF
jgi:hypothetical protein